MTIESLGLAAARGDRAAVRQLIYIIAGGRSTYSGHWYWTLMPWKERHCSWEYDLADQVKAIEALGQSGSSKALRYLHRVYRDRRTITVRPSSALQVSYFEDPIDTETEVEYPWARGPLLGSLGYREYYTGGVISRDGFDDQLHATISRAIENLEVALNARAHA